MSPRTRITDEQTEDLSYLSELEFNEFFGSVVITGSPNQTNVLQLFPDYFIESDIIIGASGTTVTTGTGQIIVSAPSGDNFSYETITSGVEITIPLYQQMTVHGTLDVQAGGTLNVEGTLVMEP